MTSTPATGLMTADDLLMLPDDGRHQYELVRGRLITMAPSSSVPALVATKFSTRLCGFVEQHGLGLCGGADWGFCLECSPDTVRVPDVAFVSGERVPAGGVPRGFWPGAPDLAIEVISPSDRFGDVMEKVQEYLDAGTRLVWVVQPDARWVRIFRADGTTALVSGDGTLDGEDVVPGFSLSLRDVWVD